MSLSQDLLEILVCPKCKGELRHDGGVVSGAPGLYRMGLNFMRRRKSSFIHGAEADARAAGQVTPLLLLVPM